MLLSRSVAAEGLGVQQRARQDREERVLKFFGRLIARPDCMVVRATLVFFNGGSGCGSEPFARSGAEEELSARPQNHCRPVQRMAGRAICRTGPAPRCVDMKRYLLNLTAGKTEAARPGRVADKNIVRPQMRRPTSLRHVGDPGQLHRKNEMIHVVRPDLRGGALHFQAAKTHIGNFGTGPPEQATNGNSPGFKPSPVAADRTI